MLYKSEFWFLFTVCTLAVLSTCIADGINFALCDLATSSIYGEGWSRSKYSLCSGENIYSLFVLECITNHVKIFINREYMHNIKFLRKYFIAFDRSKLSLKKLKL